MAKTSSEKTGLRMFWRQISDGLEMEELWKQFRTEARASYGLYSKDVDWAATGRQKGLKRVWAVVKALFLAMLMKLSPARRVVLVVALVFLVIPRIEVTQWGLRMGGNMPQLGAALLFVLLALELADRVTMKRDLEIARDIQRWLVPAAPPVVAGTDIAFATRPANTVGGDYYDAFLRRVNGEQRLLLVVADVAGKSVPAALLMATFHASLQALAAGPVGLVELVTGINRFASERSLGGMRFTTAFFAELDPATREVCCVNAGHNAPMLRRHNGAIERLTEGGLVLGVDAEAPYEAQRVKLHTGDLLVIFTDGLVEAFNDRGQEYGEGPVKEILNTVPGESAAETLRHLMQGVETHAGTTRQSDDVTLLVLRAV